MPKFSIVIPTRARPDTLVHALRTAVEQSYEDIEIIVHESGNDPRIAEIVAKLADHRTRFVKTGRPVSMTENWERALNCVTGEYVTFIGDDDGLISNACAIVSRMLTKNPAEIISWHPAAYYWPQYMVDHQRNRLQAFISEIDVLEIKSSRAMLELFYRFREDYSRLPMIYNSFIKRTLIDRVRTKLGCYFIGVAPDVSSGIIDAFFSDSFALSKRPLSVSGLSHHSTGHRCYLSGDAALRETAEAAAFDHVSIHPTLVKSSNLRLFIGNEMLIVKEQVFPREAPAFNYRNLLWTALQSIESVPADYEATLNDVREIARRNGITIDDFAVPLPTPRAAAPAQGLRPVGNDSIFMDINCALAGITNVRDAVRLLEALLPPFGEPVVIASNHSMRTIPVRSQAPVHLDFFNGGNGAVFLGFGWADLEPWGVWTLGRRAEIVLRLDGRPQRQVEIRIDGQLFVHVRRPSARGSVFLNGGRMTGFEGTFEQPDVSLQLIMKPSQFGDEEAILLEFEIDHPRSPADDGISHDTRQIGFGLKRIVVTT